jgi:hypothetical protein
LPISLSASAVARHQSSNGGQRHARLQRTCKRGVSAVARPTSANTSERETITQIAPVGNDFRNDATLGLACDQLVDLMTVSAIVFIPVASR